MSEEQKDSDFDIREAWKESMNKAMRKYALMTDSEKEVFKKDCQRGMGSVCETMTCGECITKKAYVGQEEKETEACTQD